MGASSRQARSIVTSLALLIPTLLAAGACGGEGESGAGGAPVPIADLPAKYAAALCDVVAECLPTAFERIFFGDEDCLTRTTRRIESSDFYKTEAAVEAGEVTYDGTQVQPCLDSVVANGCNLAQRSNPICNAVFGGTVEEGGACEIDEVCQGDNLCIFEGMCPGTCAPRKVAGVTCTDDDECADGLVCHSTTNRCVTPAAAGEACQGGTEPQCAFGLFCNGMNATTPGTCSTASEIQVGGEGDPCVATMATQELCQEGLVCAVTGVADAMPVFECKQGNTTAGGTCNLAFPEDCPAGQYCPLTQVDLAAGTFEAECQPLPAAGEPCVTRTGPGCEAYARCGADGMCAAMRENGETCENAGFCYSGHCVGGACAPSALCD